MKQKSPIYWSPDAGESSTEVINQGSVLFNHLIYSLYSLIETIYLQINISYLFKVKLIFHTNQHSIPIYKITSNNSLRPADTVSIQRKYTSNLLVYISINFSLINQWSQSSYKIIVYIKYCSANGNTEMWQFDRNRIKVWRRYIRRQRRYINFKQHHAEAVCLSNINHFDLSHCVHYH